MRVVIPRRAVVEAYSGLRSTMKSPSAGRERPDRYGRESTTGELFEPGLPGGAGGFATLLVAQTMRDSSHSQTPEPGAEERRDIVYVYRLRCWGTMACSAFERASGGVRLDALSSVNYRILSRRPARRAPRSEITSH